MEIKVSKALVISSYRTPRAGFFIHYYSPDLGSISAYATAVKKPGSKHYGCDELFSVQCLNLSKKKDSYRLVSSDKVMSPCFSGNLRKYYVASLAAEILERDMTEPGLDMFDMLVNYIAGHPEPPLSNDIHCLMNLLKESGWLPEIEFCPRCRSMISSGMSIQVSFTDGGFLCQDCHIREGREKIKSNFITQLAKINRSLNLSETQGISMDQANYRQAFLVLLDFYNWHRGKKLKCSLVIRNFLQGNLPL